MSTDVCSLTRRSSSESQNGQRCLCLSTSYIILLRILKLFWEVSGRKQLVEYHVSSLPRVLDSPQSRLFRRIWSFTELLAGNKSNKNAFQLDAYHPLQRPPLDVSTRGYNISLGSYPPEGTWDQTGSDIIPPPTLWAKWHTRVKTSPSRNFVCGW